MLRLELRYNIDMGKVKNDSLMFPKAKDGICRICGKAGRLTVEHIIPRKAGGGQRTKLYDPIDLLGNKPAYGEIKQKGLAGYTLCQKCNNDSGLYYDEAFSDFINDFNGCMNAFLNDKKITPHSLKDKEYCITYKTPRKVKPLNIAKRVLVSFCSNEKTMLTVQYPDIRKTIMNPEHKIENPKFRIYLSALTGGCGGFFSDIVLFTKNYGIQAHSGIEYAHMGFYLKKDVEPNAVVPPSMLDITNWLIDFDYNQTAEMTLTLPLVLTQGMPIMSPK